MRCGRCWNPGRLKIGQNLKFDWQMFAQRGIEIASYDDTMLMSYALDAGRNAHGLDPLARALASAMPPSSSTK
jgi:DNA polymerase-1